MLLLQATIVIFVTITTATCCVQSINIVKRSEWGGRPPASVNRIDGELPFVVIHHSAIPEACYSTLECMNAMRVMQDMHQYENGWDDIGYSYAVGGDGQIYEGRGFKVVGAHAVGYNDKSVGICLIGNWSDSPPPQIMLSAAQLLIEYGIRTGHIESNYTLIGHREAGETECPGDELFRIIQGWKNFENI